MDIENNKIGEGLQYRVYSLKHHSSKVVKFPDSKENMARKLASWNGFSDSQSYEAVKDKYLEIGSNLENNLKVSLLKITPLLEDAQLFDLLLKPRLMLIPSGIYVQERVQPIASYLESNELIENKHVIDEYIKANQLLWQFGIYEYIHQFQKNAGVVEEDGEKKVKLIDFGEVTFELNEAKRIVAKKGWLELDSFTQIKDKVLQKYVEDTFEKAFVPEEVEKYWEKSIVK